MPDLPIRVKILLAALLVVTVAGCSSVGTPIARDKVNQIQPGLTTEQDVLRMFGVPSTKTLDTSGRMVLSWIFSSASAKPQTFIPVAGAFVGGYNTRLQQLTILIDKKGRVQSWTLNDKPGEMKYGRTR
jgi:outer membrane protein assembly factor BamE (lipoprotein component of BamABCDE complex)